MYLTFIYYSSLLPLYTSLSLSISLSHTHTFSYISLFTHLHQTLSNTHDCHKYKYSSPYLKLANVSAYSNILLLCYTAVLANVWPQQLCYTAVLANVWPQQLNAHMIIPSFSEKSNIWLLDLKKCVSALKHIM